MMILYYHRKSDICVERKSYWKLSGVPEEFTIHYYDNQLYERLRESLSLSDVEHVKVFKTIQKWHDMICMVVNDEWLG